MRLHIETARLEAMALVLFTVLVVRGVKFTDHDRDRIIRCTDSLELGWWVVNASTATSIDDVFQPSPDEREATIRCAAVLVAQGAVQGAPYASGAGRFERPGRHWARAIVERAWMRRGGPPLGR
jgi:hypothetical protein